MKDVNFKAAYQVRDSSKLHLSYKTLSLFRLRVAYSSPNQAVPQILVDITGGVPDGPGQSIPELEIKGQCRLLIEGETLVLGEYAPGYSNLRSELQMALKATHSGQPELDLSHSWPFQAPPTGSPPQRFMLSVEFTFNTV